MSVAITVQNALKKFEDGSVVIPDLSIKVRNGELFTLLGPSGCGKTTLLRMIAGFNSIEGGKIYFDDREINDVDPGKRNIGMVFQNYAIFPNMTVRKNVAFGLRTRKLPPDQIKKETDTFLKLVHVDQYADRMPDRLSGGQQQRVALARALVIQPDVLLMDEPLSNLDAKLRVEMRSVIKEIQKNVGITTVYVTHDQEEAMAISDRIAVMKSGVIHQCGRPQDIYMRPADTFVAGFIGKSNMMEASLSWNGEDARLEFAGGYAVSVKTIDPAKKLKGKVLISCRPEELIINQNKDDSGISAEIVDSVFLGLNTHYFVQFATGERTEIIRESDVNKMIPVGTKISLKINTEKINIFNADSKESIMQGVKRIDEGE